MRPKGSDPMAVDLPALEQKLASIVRDWRDELREQLVKRHGEETGLKLADCYGRALPAGYIEEVSPGTVSYTHLDVYKRQAEGAGQALHQRGLHRQVDGLRGGHVDHPPGAADPRRDGLLEGNADRALLPRLSLIHI